ncbi:MAG: hypothetical protein WD801_00670 [Gemmatimonadaceae bacterium]
MIEDPARTPRARPPQRPDAGSTGGAQDTPRVVAQTLELRRVTDNLRDTMGVDGCTALLERGLMRTETHHPALTLLRRQHGRELHLDGVAAAVEIHGLAAVEKAITALMEALIEVLSRLIGEDMAIRIINLGAPQDQRRRDSK